MYLERQNLRPLMADLYTASMVDRQARGVPMTWTADDLADMLNVINRIGDSDSSAWLAGGDAGGTPYDLCSVSAFLNQAVAALSWDQPFVTFKRNCATMG